MVTEKHILIAIRFTLLCHFNLWLIEAKQMRVIPNNLRKFSLEKITLSNTDSYEKFKMSHDNDVLSQV